MSSKFFPIDIVNMSTIATPLLKDYYWESMQLSSLSRHLSISGSNNYLSSNLKLPPMPIDSQPIKIIMHFKNQTNDALNWCLKRIKLCDCKMKQVKMAINKFRLVHDCRHRDLLEIYPNNGETSGFANFTLTLDISYGLIGDHVLAFELILNKDKTLRLNFLLNVVGFDPKICIVTTALFPVAVMTEIHQPIWIFNPFRQDLNMELTAEEYEMKILTPSFQVKALSLVPIPVVYRPYQNATTDLHLKLKLFDIQSEFEIKASGTRLKDPIPAQLTPKDDIHSQEYPFVIYKNYIGVKLDCLSDGSIMLVAHNFYDQKVDFKWHEGEVDGYFHMRIEPSTTCCKPNHSVFFVVRITTGNRPCVFPRFPLMCDVYKHINPLDNYSEDLAGSYDSLLFETNFLLRLFVNVNIKIIGNLNIDMRTIYSKTNVSEKGKFCSIPSGFDITYFEQMFWDRMFDPKTLETILDTDIQVSYNDLNEPDVDEREERKSPIDRKTTAKFLRLLLQNAIEEVSSRWRFVPVEYAK